MSDTQSFQLATFVPALLRRKLSQSSAVTPAHMPLRGALLFADVSGFSKLAERFAKDGPEGAERISSCLNSYFSNLISRIEAHGGDVFKFAGDALLAFWPDAEGRPGAVAAAHCGLEVQRDMTRVLVAEDVYLSTRLGIGTGAVEMLLVGGQNGRWETLPLGDPFRQLRATHAKASPGELAVSAEAWAALATEFAAKPLADGVLRIESAKSAPARVPLPATDLPDDAHLVLRGWVPSAVTSRIDAGLSGFLGELRRVSVLFAGLPVSSEGDDVLQRVQPLVSSLQHAVYSHEGAINKISVDDKGAVLVAVFGLPPNVHEDDAVRGAHAALAVQQALAGHGLRGSIGVATGEVFCGTVGGATRCEYTVLGHVVNLAARLMEAAKGGILADEATHQGARHKLGFEALPAITVKGRSEPVAVFVPSATRRAESRSRTPLVARLAEQAALREVVDAAASKAATRTGIVMASAGMGKSRLTDEICRYAVDCGVRVVAGAGLPVERNIGYRAFRPLVEELLGLEGNDAAAKRAQAESAVAALEGMAELAPLLDAIVPLDLPDNDRTRPLQGEARARQTNELVCKLVQAAADKMPLLVVVEDAHWLDSASWRLLRDLQASLQGVGLLVATRPMPTPQPEDFAPISTAPRAQLLQLQPLSQQDAAQLAAQRLGVQQIPDAAAELIASRADGNALYIEEMAFVLRDHGALTVQDGACLLTVPPEELAKLALPATVQGLIVSRVDRLDPRHQMVLKVASAIDRLFPLEVLQGVYPEIAERAQLPSWMPALVSADMLRPEDVSGAEGYLFKHVLTQEAVYGLMLFAQRRQLHRTIAEFYEARGGTDFAVLAHHWQNAEDWPKAVQCNELAGEQALKRWASREAISFFLKAQEIDGAHQVVGHDPLRLARWQWSIGEASFRLGDLDEAQASGRRALQLAGRAVPTTPLGATVGFLGQVAIRLYRKYFAMLTRLTPAQERPERLWATNILNRLTEIHIYRENPPGLLDSAMRELTTAEPVGPSAELARAYAILTVVFSTIPLPALCKAWAVKALAIAEVSGDPEKLGYVCSRIGVYRLCAAEWPLAERELRRSIALARDYGDRRLRIESLSVLGYTMLYQGKLAEMEPLFEQVGVMSREANDQQVLSWHHGGGGAGFLRRGMNELALHHLSLAVQFKVSSSEQVTFFGLHALALYRNGKKAEAKQQADHIYPLVAGKRPVAYWTQHGICSLNQTYLALWDEAAAAGGDTSDLQARAKAMAKVAMALGQVFPFAVPQGHVWLGACARRLGQFAKAAKHLDLAIRLAGATGVPYEAAQAWQEKAKMPGVSASQAREFLGNAALLFEQMGARHDLAQVQQQIAALPA